jgi:hypothetical protein
VIIKRTRGVSAAKALAYDYGPGRAMEHHNPRRVAGTVAGRDWRGRGRTMQAKIRDDGDNVAGKRGRVIRLAVAAAPGDRVLSDRDWSAIAQRVVGEFTGSAEGYAWEAVRHDPRHIHITLLQRGHDGRLLSESHDYRRFGRISDGVERDYALTRVERGAGRPRVDRAAVREAVQRQRSAARTAADRTPQDSAPSAPQPAADRGARPPRRTDPAPTVREQPSGGKRDPRPHLGWDHARQAQQLGPKPQEWDGWTPTRQRDWIRARMADYQRSQKQQTDRGRDGGIER